MLTKKKNVLTRFREFFKALPDQEQKELWDVLVTLRGDDAEKCPPLKMFVTGRIRGELLRVTHKHTLPLGAYIFQTPTQAENASGEYSKPTLIELKQMFTNASTHWRSHVITAIRHILKYNPRRARDLHKFITWMRW